MHLLDSWLYFCIYPQNPREADAMTKVQAELDETKIILVNHRSYINQSREVSTLIYTQILHCMRTQKEMMDS